MLGVVGQVILASWARAKITGAKVVTVGAGGAPADLFLNVAYKTMHQTLSLDTKSPCPFVHYPFLETYHLAKVKGTCLGLGIDRHRMAA